VDSQNQEKETLYKPNDEEFNNKVRDLIQRLKNNSFKKVIFLLGAGISVGAGIPDFRTPKRGLFSNFTEYNVPYPEALFERDFFCDNPEPLYKFLKFFWDKNPSPTFAHFFIKQFEKKKILEMIFTQNIDGLEHETGISSKKIIHAHGTLREAKCLKCKKNQDQDVVVANICKGSIFYCKCGGLVRPNILFYEEKMPKKFDKNAEKIKDADLVFIMGTSLKVSPFDRLVHYIRNDSLIVIVNKDKIDVKCQNQLFFQGDIQIIAEQLCDELQWRDVVLNDMEKYKQAKQKIS